MCSQGKIIKEGEFVQIFGNDIQINEQGELTYPCVVEQFTNDSLSEEDTDLLNLLKEFDLEKLFHDLKNAGITFRSLKFLSKEDIAEAIKNIGLRAEFREKLFFWRKSKFGIEDETLSQTSKVVGWLEKTRDNDSPCSSNNSIKSAFGSQNNLTGKELIQYYEERACFTNKQRDDLIKIILEDVMISKAKLRPEHFTSIVEEIIGLFPKEKESQDYYYIPRERKKNPSGKLYSKYFNLKTKIRKSNSSQERSLLNEVRDPLVEENVEVDETLSLCLKSSLQKDASNWVEVIDKWQKTFSFRKKDLAKLSNSEFLHEWPILKDFRAPFLINLDFNLICPQKDNLLKTKVDNLKTKIVTYYNVNIRNQLSINLLKQAKTTKKIDCQDYILTILLNSVLLPSARFSADGNSKKKATIKDANESFVLQLTTISDYSRRIKELIGKYEG